MRQLSCISILLCYLAPAYATQEAQKAPVVLPPSVQARMAYCKSQEFREKLKQRTARYTDPKVLDAIINRKKHAHAAWADFWQQPLIRMDWPTAVPLTDPTCTEQAVDGTYKLILARKADLGGVGAKTLQCAVAWVVHQTLHQQAASTLGTLACSTWQQIKTLMENPDQDQGQAADAISKHLRTSCTYRTIMPTLATHAAINSVIYNLRAHVALEQEQFIERAYGLGLEWWLYTHDTSDAVQMGLTGLRTPEEQFKERSMREAFLWGVDQANGWLSKHGLMNPSFDSWWWHGLSNSVVYTMLARWYLQTLAIPFLANYMVTQKEAFQEAINLPPSQRDHALYELTHDAIAMPFGTWLALCKEQEAGYKLLAACIPLASALYQAGNDLKAWNNAQN